MNSTESYLELLPNKELIQIAEELNQQYIAPGTLSRKLASKIFGIAEEVVTLVQLIGLGVPLSLELAKRLKEVNAEDVPLKRDIPEHIVGYIESLIDLYPETIWWGNSEEKSFCCCLGDPNKVVVYQRGVRGPADCFGLNQEGKWYHTGYTAYKETYDQTEFADYVKKMNEYNNKNK